MPTFPVLIFEVSQHAVSALAAEAPGTSDGEAYQEIAEGILDFTESLGIAATVMPPGVKLAFNGMVTHETDELPDVDEEDYSEDPQPATEGEATSPAARVQSELLAYDGSKLSTDHPLIVAIRNWLPDCKIPRVITAAQRGYQGNAAADYLAEVAAKCDLWWNGTAFKSI